MKTSILSAIMSDTSHDWKQPENSRSETWFSSDYIRKLWALKVVISRMYISIPKYALALATAGAMIGLATPQARAQDETSQVVNVWKTSSSPVVSSTNIYWEYVVRNNSHILPEEGPYGEDITNVRLLNLYSSSQATIDNDDWKGSVTTNDKPNLYNIELDGDNLEKINCGDNQKFKIITYIPSTNHVLIVGASTNEVPKDDELRGQGAFPSAGWQPLDPDNLGNPDKGGDPFTGPVGALEFIANEGGSIRPSTNYFTENQSASFYIEAHGNKRLEKVNYNGSETFFNPNITNTTYTINNVGRTGTVEAVFGPALYNLEVLSAHPWFGDAIGNPGINGVAGTQAMGIAHGNAVTVSVDRIVVDPENPGRRLRVKEIRVE